MELYKDELYETKMIKDLDNARCGLQTCLTAWDALNLTPCTNLMDLIMNPAKLIERAVNEVTEVPQTPGRLQMNKQAYIDTLQLPDTNELYTAVKLANTLPFVRSGMLWSIQDNEVILNKEESEKLIKVNSLEVEDPEKIKLIEDLKKLTDLMNDLNIRLGGELFDTSTPNTNRFICNKWKALGTDSRCAGGWLELDVETLRRWVIIYPIVK